MPISFAALACACLVLLIALMAPVLAWRRLKKARALDESSRRRGIEGACVQAGPYRMFFRIARRRTRAAGRLPVVLVHGLVVSSRYMEPLAQALTHEFDVFAPDLPGFGESPLARARDALSIAQLADALRLWLNACGFERAMFVGNSFGCQVLADFAIRYPQTVDRLVLQAPTPDPRARSLPRQVWRDWRNGMRERPRTPAEAGRIDYVKAGPWRAFATMRMLVRDPIDERLPRIAAPTLVVVGTRDPVAPLAWAKEAARRLPRGTLLTLEGGTHTLNYAAPNAFALAITPFLKAGAARA